MIIELTSTQQIELIALCTAKKIHCENSIIAVRNQSELADSANFLEDMYSKDIIKMDSLINLLQPS